MAIRNCGGAADKWPTQSPIPVDFAGDDDPDASSYDATRGCLFYDFERTHRRFPLDWRCIVGVYGPFEAKAPKKLFSKGKMKSNRSEKQVQRWEDRLVLRIAEAGAKVALFERFVAKPVAYRCGKVLYVTPPHDLHAVLRREMLVRRERGTVPIPYEAMCAMLFVARECETRTKQLPHPLGRGVSLLTALRLPHPTLKWQSGKWT